MANKFGMKGYMKGALLLTIAALLVKILSAIYRVPFQNLVGDQGFYIYQQVYPFISIFVVWTSGGFAVAISKMLADAESNAMSIEQKSMITRTIFLYLTTLSIVFFSLLFFGATQLAHMMGDIQLAPLLKTGAFVTLFMPMLALLKGAFQSKGDMAPVAYAQVFEQFVRVCIILVGAFMIMQTSKSLYAAGNMAVFGTIIGEVAGVVLLLYFSKKSSLLVKPQKIIQQPKWPILKEVTVLSLSVSMSSLLLLCFQLIDSFTVFSLLVENGMEKMNAMETKGIYDRGQPLVQLGVTIASSLSLAIVPLIAYHSKQKSGRGPVPFIQLTFRASVLLAVAASLGLVIVMPYVNEMLFETSVLSNVLIVYVLQIVPLSIILTFTAMLQGMDKLKIPAVILIVAILVKYIGNHLFIPQFGVLGAAVTSDIGLFLSASLLIIYLKRLMGIQLAKQAFYIKLIFASVGMTVSVFIMDKLLQTLNHFITGRLEAVVVGGSLIFIGAFVFLTIVAKTKILAEKEWFMLPFGRKMAIYQLFLNKKK
ncbi:polysaccharide biosynthesis protein [Lysinibacillus sp. BW-2-10]|uniref:putative polysaccharide biosynthesis protein n=1 Tax=Lysinibacillus sp. BW-2-10 TaxID=2590030 RepID=UPI001180F39F|nr:polysaccharide biosynthesis protein [Lysinibacillus sp. BW-2-10]TSI05472.1 polysaccharide biosynthesis protein [Lysinibacillus sp. BW-2-10]